MTVHLVISTDWIGPQLRGAYRKERKAEKKLAKLQERESWIDHHIQTLEVQ